MGNWVAEIPPWYDERTGLFYSYYFGTDGVREHEGGLNRPAHLRCVNICLLAYEISREKRYLDLCTRHTGLWADAVLAGDALPMGLLPTGPVYAKALGCPDDQVLAAEQFVASNGIGALLKLWALTGEGRFRRAAERLLDVVATQVGDPDAGPGADAIRAYRRATGDTRYDKTVVSLLRDIDPRAIEEIGIETGEHTQPWPRGIGKRGDMPRWFEDGTARRVNPITLAVAAEIAMDKSLATCALDLARTYLVLARATRLPDGRHHGCAASTISAIARGHGRDNHAGMTTAVLEPLMQVFWS
jgi:hypothetical protein